MPKIRLDKLTINYDRQGTGEPLILIPYLAADHACYAFQTAEYAKHFTCISIDPRDAGESDKTDGVYSTEDLADDVAAFLQAQGIPRAHSFGLSLGAATGMWLAVKYPSKVKSLSLHSGWAKTDPFIKAVVEGWQATVKGLANVAEMIILSMFPWCFTPELYAAKPEYIQSLASFVRSRPAQSVAAFLQQSNAAITHDAAAQLGRIRCPTQVTFGRHDLVTSTRFADQLTGAIPHSELVIFEGSSHAPIYESTEEFNQKTMAFWQRHAPLSAAPL
jgi:pimeloyl-ACP methyl ester carboxylesterase